MFSVIKDQTHFNKAVFIISQPQFLPKKTTNFYALKYRKYCTQYTQYSNISNINWANLVGPCLTNVPLKAHF